jgi:peptidoglycan/xylan/chitin deacetylase (PgdA/CDA1 family)
MWSAKVRVQLLVAACGLLLFASGGKVLGGQSAIRPLPSRAQHLATLTQLHARGDLRQKARQQQAVLGAHTAAPIIPNCAAAVCIALTFDDGPNPLTTPQILNILEAEHVPATFFVVGARVGGNEALLQRMHADGDEIGNHSWSHPNLPLLPPEQIKQQVQQTQAAVTAAGVPAPTLFRPPYGAVTQAVRDSIVPLTLAFWNEDPRDWAATNAQQVLAASIASAKAGGVVDMHDIYKVTADALQPLIQNLKSRQFQFVTMTQLMAARPGGSGGEFYGLP